MKEIDSKNGREHGQNETDRRKNGHFTAFKSL